MATPGLRERKMARTRQHIADTAARLFAEHGYEQVAVSDIAREAEVSEQTVYNHFRTKESLVVDRDQGIQDQLDQLIRDRPAGVSPAAAIRDFVLSSVTSIADIPPEVWRGEIGSLAARSRTVHRMSLEMSDRQADVIGAAIHDTSPVGEDLAKIQGLALAGVYQVIFAHAGRRTREGQSQAQISRELRPVVEEIIDDLDRWLSVRDRDDRQP